MTKSVFHGIDPKTFEVVRITLTNDNVLHHYGEHGTYDHVVLSGRLPKNEVVIVWHLIDIIEVMPGFSDSETEKKRVNDLREKAASMKAAAEKQKED